MIENDVVMQKSRGQQKGRQKTGEEMEGTASQVRHGDMETFSQEVTPKLRTKDHRK